MQRNILSLRDHPEMIHFAALIQLNGGSVTLTKEDCALLPPGAAIVFETENFFDDSPVTARVVGPLAHLVMNAVEIGGSNED